ncbi:hypothetical protein AGMMS49940_08730 [Spirochaetia bacterium]|nr:hypothetical protein AGMMS49940_08730 [Spirochaetia bacterium]
MHKISALLLSALALASCASSGAVTAVPEWAKTKNGVVLVYPNEKYIARRGRGSDLISAQNNGIAEISRWITSQVETSQSSRFSLTRRGDEDTVSQQTNEETFIRSQTGLFAVRYAPDSWYNKAEGQWETVAYIDRDEAWSIYEPQVRQKADTFQNLFQAAADASGTGEPLRQFFMYSGALTVFRELEPMLEFGEIINPVKAGVYRTIRASAAELPLLLDRVTEKAAVFIQCNSDPYNNVYAALSGILSSHGFPVQQSRNASASIFEVVITENMSELEAGYFYDPTLTVTVRGKTGVLFTYTPRIARVSAGKQNPELARRRAYDAAVKEIQNSFYTEFSQGVVK